MNDDLLMRMLQHEDKAKQDGFRLILGVDEAGRGPLAGPVVASAVALKTYKFHNKICDSKKISASQREKAFGEIFENAYVGIGIISETVIDMHNILNATYYAMNNAIRDLITKLPESLTKNAAFNGQVCILVDGGRFKTDLPYSYKTIIRGDALSLSVASASIVAKVTRDRILAAYHKVFPQYGFCKHKGYPTAAHKKAIKEHGLSIIHRKTFNYI